MTSAGGVGTPADEAGAGAFEHAAGFSAGEVSGGFGLGPLETQYEELFAEVLEDGIITADERARLERAADNLGIDRGRLARLEQAMVAAYQTRHRVQIVEHYEESAPSLAPIRVEAGGDAGRAMLLKRIEQLEARVRELEGELRRAQANINVEVDLSGFEADADRASEDPEEIWRRTRRNPTDPRAYRELHRVLRSRGDVDRSFCVAQCLVALGAANDAERAEYEAGRAQTLIAPKASLSSTAWVDQLFHPEEELLTGQIFSVIAPAVLVGRVTALRRDGKLHQPSPELRQDVAKATITAVRALPWASAILGLPAPPVFVERDRDVGYEHIPAIPPVTVVGKRVLSGRTQLEHAFLVARHLCFYRHEHYVRSLFSSIPDLEDLFLAALVIANPGLPIAEDMKQRVAPIARAIQPLLEPAQLDTLRGCFFRFVEEGGRTNLQRWSVATEKTACRAGLLLANDLHTALGLLEAEEGRLGELAKDLLVFAASERYGGLRRQLGIARG
jgi:golgin subfamily B member 1